MTTTTTMMPTLAGVWNEATDTAPDGMTADHLVEALTLRRELPDSPGFRKARLAARQFFRHAAERLADPELQITEAKAIRDLAAEFQNYFAERKIRAEMALGQIIMEESND